MADIERYWSLLKRQRAKVSHARALLPLLEECVRDVGPNPSWNEVARWMNARGAPPSANAKPHAKWVAQTVVDYAYMDGIDPTPESIRQFDVAQLNQGGVQRRLRDLGFRFSATLEWTKVRAALEREKGTERLAYEERQLADHLRQIVEVSRLFRTTLRIPQL